MTGVRLDQTAEPPPTGGRVGGLTGPDVWHPYDGQSVCSLLVREAAHHAGTARANDRFVGTEMVKPASRLRADLVRELREEGVIGSEAVADAFATVPRERFIPQIVREHGLDAVYRDEAFVTKKDSRGMPLSSSSQPALMAQMLDLLQLQPGQRVLEIGAGTGYNAALLSHLVGPRG